MPPHLHKLKTELEKTFESLERKNEMLMNAMMKNFGKTQQDLPNFKLPEIQSAKKQTLFQIQSDPDNMGFTQPFTSASFSN